MKLEPNNITIENFQPFGTLLTDSLSSPKWSNEQFDFTPDVYLYHYQKRLSSGILIGKKRPIKPNILEKHVATSEILIQLVNDAILYLAERSIRNPSENDISAFFLRQGEGVALKEGTWHWVPFPINTDCKTLIFFDEGTGDNDQFIHEL
jgi:ureidoglycolate hydrolase